MRSAVLLKNTSKSHVAFKVRTYVLVKFECKIKLFIIHCMHTVWLKRVTKFETRF